MKTRPICEADREVLETWNISGFEVPGFDGPLCLDAQAVEDDEGYLIAVIVAKKTVELVLAIDPKRHPALKLAAIRKLQGLLYLLKVRGYSEAGAFIPPGIEKAYGRRLRALGWLKGWQNYCVRF